MLRNISGFSRLIVLRLTGNLGDGLYRVCGADGFCMCYIFLFEMLCILLWRTEFVISDVSLCVSMSDT